MNDLFSAFRMAITSLIALPLLGVAQGVIPPTVEMVLPNATPTLSVGVALGSTRYQSTERTASGVVSNQETGSLPRFTATARWQQDAWFVDGNFSLARHDIAYEGYTQFGVPLSTTTALALNQGGLVAGYRWRTAGDSQWRLSTGLERLQVRRNILPSMGSLPLREVLTSTRLVAGGVWQHDWPRLILAGRVMPLNLSASVDMLYALRNRLDVDSLGLYDPITLQPGRSLDWRLGLKSELTVARGVTASAGWVWERFNPGESSTEVWRQGGVPAVGVRYPGSQQRFQTFMFGLGWMF